MRSSLWLLLALVAVASRPATANAIYRCAGSAGEAAFSDLPCPGGQVQTTRPAMTIDMAVSVEEQKVLDRLARRASPTRTMSRSSNEERATRRTNQDARRCAAAEAALERIHAKKRSGYRASSAAALDARQREAQTKRDRDCSR